jgi:Phage integrase family
MLLGGGRASATGALLWRDIDLANGRFQVGRDKTDAGMREVDMLPLPRELLTEHKAASEKTAPNDPVCITSTGTARSRHNLRQDVVEPVVNRANRLVEERGLQPLPLGITPHKLRHTFASILVAIGKDPTSGPPGHPGRGRRLASAHRHAARIHRPAARRPDHAHPRERHLRGRGILDGQRPRRPRPRLRQAAAVAILRLPAAMGCSGWFTPVVRTNGELRAALQRARGETHPSYIEVRLQHKLDTAKSQRELVSQYQISAPPNVA